MKTRMRITIVCARKTDAELGTHQQHLSEGHTDEYLDEERPDIHHHSVCQKDRCGTKKRTNSICLRGALMDIRTWERPDVHHYSVCRKARCGTINKEMGFNIWSIILQRIQSSLHRSIWIRIFVKAALTVSSGVRRRQSGCGTERR